MKICITSKLYPPEDSGSGIATYTYNLAHGLTSLGNDVHVLSFTLGTDKDYMDGSVHVHRIGLRDIKGMWRFKKVLPVEDILYSIRVAQKLRKLIKEYKIDIVEFPNWQAEGLWYLLKKRDIPVVTRLHTPKAEVIKNKNGKILVSDMISCLLEKFVASKSDILTSSTFIHKKNIAKTYKVDFENIKVVPLGIDLRDMDSYKTSVSFNNGSFNLLYASRLESRKGIEVLLKAMPELIDKYPNIHLHLIGKDTDRKYANFFMKKYGDSYLSNVHFLGYKDKNELNEYFKRCDLLVVPSLYESFGLVYLEAMKYSKPVVGCKVGGVPEVISNGEDGILIPPNDKDSLSKAIIYLLTNQDVGKKMGEKGFQKAKACFSTEKMAEETLKIYRSIVNANTKF